MSVKANHMQKITYLFFSLFLLKSAFSQEFEAPKAEKIFHQTLIHGDTLTDNYFWMRDKYSAEVVNYLYANNAYSDRVMKGSQNLQKVLYEEFRSRIKETFDTRPRKSKQYYYYSRYFLDKDYALMCRKKDSLTAKEQTVLDLNQLAKEFMYFSLQIVSYNPEQSLLAYGIDTKGHNVSTLYIKHIEGDSLLINEKIDSVLDVAWTNDNKTFYYTTAEPKTKRAFRVYKHTIGNDIKSDELIFEEPDKTYQIGLDNSASRQYIFMTISKTKSNEIWFWDANNSNAKPNLFYKRQPDLFYNLNHFDGNEFFISTNYQALNYQLMTAPAVASTPKEWKTYFPHRKNILFSGYNMFKDFFVWEETENAIQRILIKNKNTNTIDTLKPKLDWYSIGFSVEDYNYNHSKNIEYAAENMIHPSASYKYDLYTQQQTFIEMDSINGKYDATKYETVRLYAKASDGTMVPMTIAYKKGMVRNGNNPVFLTSYGSYGGSSFPSFSTLNISYMDRGFILATAHIRGGRELGTEWYENGKMLNKRNTFTDFIACAEYLVNEKYTNPKRLAIQGGSAGGLLMGAVNNLRPDLFKCVVANVPFVDVMNTMLDETIPLTTFEFEEWGNPKIKKYYDYMKSYSPYDNVTAKNYPDMIVTAGYNDAQVGYWEPAKWVAKLRELKTDTNLLLFKTNMDGGHGGASGRYAQLKEQAFQMAFAMQSLGVKENYIILKGKVVDGNNEPITYANIYLEGTGNGTTTNGEGGFELQVKEMDKSVLIFQCIGYEKQKIKLTMDSRITNFIVKMKSENVQLKTVDVNANAKDPALAIIKEAIKHRKENDERVKSFSSDVYMRSNVRLLEIPKKIPKFLLQGEKIDSNDIGLIYLSESVAKYYAEKPDNTKEEMVASKVAGQKQGFSWNRVADAFFNLYQPSIHLDYYSDRPFISPIAPLATLSYKYKFKGSFYVDKKEVNKIEVIPLRKGDPLFQGHIYITQDDYQIYASDLRITKDAGIQFVDTVNLQQEMINLNGNWVPLQMKIGSHIKVFGFGAADINMASMTNYQLNRTFPSKFFNNEVFKIEKSANKKDSTYWTNNRLVVLTQEESKHYLKADSIYKAENSPAYRDSVQHARNKMSMGELLLTGYYNRRGNDSVSKSFSFNPLLFALGYNTVEGAVVNYSFNYYKIKREDHDYLLISPTLRYGFVNQNFAGGVRFYKTLNANNKSSINIKVGRYIEQYNSSNPINSLINTGYTLFARENYMKLLQKDMLNISTTRELTNGLYGRVNLQYHIREAMVNHADYAWSKHDREFTSNNPLAPLNDALAFLKHQTVEYGFSFVYLPKQKYESIDGYKQVIGSKYPDIYASFKNGIGLDNIKFNYQYMDVGTGKDIALRALGTFSFDVTAGMFFNTKNMTFADYKHFNGNQTLFLHNPENTNTPGVVTRTRLNSFHALNYYTLSSNDKFIEVHVMQNFKGFFIGKIPLLRVLKGYEIVGINFMTSPVITYNELYLGLDHILGVARVDVGRVISNGGSNDWFLRLGLALSF